MNIAPILYLSDADVAGLLTLEACIPVVEQAFASYAEGRSLLFPVVREKVGARDGIFGVKSGFVPDQGLLGFKAGGFWERNRELGLAPHQSSIVLFDPDTGATRALVAANTITWLRTGAVGAIAAKHLAPPGARTAAVIGCGMQGQIQVRALAASMPDLATVACFDAHAPSMSRFVAALADLGLDLRPAASAEEAVRGAEVIVTTTPSWEPIVRAEWVGANAHVTAIGADTKGKQELDVELFRGAKVVVDDWAQAREIGESQHAYRAGWLDASSLHAELGQLCAGTKPGRDAAGGRTIFDATGVALQDLVTAGLALRLAQERRVGTTIEP